MEPRLRQRASGRTRRPWTRLFRGGRAPGSDDATRPQILAEALLRMWATLAVPRRPVLVVEDLQWVDEQTWAVVESLAQRAGASGLRLVLTTRPEGPQWQRIHRLIESRAAVRVELPPLTQPDVARLAASWLDGEPPAALLARVAAAGGSPLLVEEVLDDLVRSGSLTRRADGWQFQATALRVPTSLGASTRAKLAGLAAMDRRILQHSAMLGRRIDAAVLARALGVGLEDVAAAVEAGADCGSTQDRPGPRSGPLPARPGARGGDRQSPRRPARRVRRRASHCARQARAERLRRR